MASFLPTHLPAGWQQLPLESLVTRMSNGISKRQTKDGNGLPVSRIETISYGVIDLARVGYLSGLTANEAEKYRLESGDLLFSHINSDLHLGKTAVFSMEGETLLHGMNLLLIRVDRDKLLPVYLHWLFNYYRVAGLFMSIAQHAVNQSSINQRKLNALPIVVPPLDGQRRIVAEIEKQFTRLEAGVAALRRVQANLKRYRAAVLKAACEGRLVPTEAELARAEGRPFESGQQLLARILTERRQNWQGRGSFVEPAAPDASSLPKLPIGWTWARVEQLSNVVRGASPRPAGDPRFFGGNVPWITVGPLTADNSPYLKAVPSSLNELGREHSRYIEPQTLLLTNSGATLGVPKITLIGGCINDGVAALLDVGHPLKLYLLYFLRTQTEGLRGVNQGAAQPNLNTTIIKDINVPLPPLAEQTRIVAEVERRLSVVEELEAVVTTNLQRATRLRQSILQKAFAGEL
jgi:type I restriction enzyme S subunit